MVGLRLLMLWLLRLLLMLRVLQGGLMDVLVVGRRR